MENKHNKGVNVGDVPGDVDWRKFDPRLPPDMTLLDWFAGQAMIAVLSGSDMPEGEDEVAEYAYTQAAAMLAERERRMK